MSSPILFSFRGRRLWLEALAHPSRCRVGIMLVFAEDACLEVSFFSLTFVLWLWLESYPEISRRIDSGQRPI